MSTLTITAKGQVTLRKDVLAHLGLRPGQRVTVEKLPDGRLELHAAKPAGAISDVFGMLRRPDGPHLSLADIDRIAAEGWAGKR